MEYLNDVQLQTPNLGAGFKKFKSRFFLEPITVFSKELGYPTDLVWDAVWKLLFVKILKFSSLGYNYMPKNNVKYFVFLLSSLMLTSVVLNMWDVNSYFSFSYFI